MDRVHRHAASHRLRAWMHACLPTCSATRENKQLPAASPLDLRLTHTQIFYKDYRAPISGLLLNHTATYEPAQASTAATARVLQLFFASRLPSLILLSEQPPRDHLCTPQI